MRRLFFLVLSLWCVLVSAGPEVIIPMASDLQSDGELQKSTGKTILLYVASHGCVYCARLEKEIIKPMIRGGHYDNKIIIRKIIWESTTPINDFAGEKRLPVDLLLNYRIQVTPTLLFLQGDGSEVANRLVGYQGGDFYWYYLDEAIDQSH